MYIHAETTKAVKYRNIFFTQSLLLPNIFLVGGRFVVPWDRKPYLGPTEILSFVYLVQFKDGGHRVSLRLHLFVFDVNPGN